MAAGVDRCAAEVARAAEGSAAIDRHRAGQRAVDDQSALVDRRRAGICVSAPEHQGPGACLGEGAGWGAAVGDRAGECRGGIVVAADRKAVAVQLHAGGVKSDRAGIAQSGDCLAGADENVAPGAMFTAVEAPGAAALLELSVPAATFTMSPAFIEVAAALERQGPRTGLGDRSGDAAVVKARRTSVPAPPPLLATSKVGSPVSKTPPMLPKVRL